MLISIPRKEACIFTIFITSDKKSLSNFMKLRRTWSWNRDLWWQSSCLVVWPCCRWDHWHDSAAACKRREQGTRTTRRSRSTPSFRWPPASILCSSKGILLTFVSRRSVDPSFAGSGLKTDFKAHPFSSPYKSRCKAANRSWSERSDIEWFYFLMIVAVRLTVKAINL